MLSDQALLQFTRGIPTERLRPFDTDRSGDVSLCMLWLYTLARTIYARSILEIGCADGSTTLPLLKAAEESNGNVQSVDMHNCEIAHKDSWIIEASTQHRDSDVHRLQDDHGRV